jgi:hypothetical protein
MFDLTEELKRVRRFAEEVDDGILLYLLDMAIVEAKKAQRAAEHGRHRQAYMRNYMRRYRANKKKTGLIVAAGR